MRIRAARVSLVAALAGALIACTPEQRAAPTGQFLTGERWDPDSVAALEVDASLPDHLMLYHTTLKGAFVRLARAELDEFDWDDGAYFLALARESATKTPPQPATPDSRDLGEPEAEALAKAQGQVLGWLSRDGWMRRAPEEIAIAHGHYECWLQEAEEGHQTAEIESCREQFNLMVIVVLEKASLPKNMAVILPGAEGRPNGIELSQNGKTVTLDREFAAAGTGKALGAMPVSEGEIRDAFADALKAKPKPPVEFALTFETASAGVNDIAFEQILLAAAEARTRKGAEVIVTGYADAVGDTAYNRGLSMRRAEAVRKAVSDELRDSEEAVFQIDAKGETDLAVETPASEPLNRRVIILVR